MCAGTLQSYSTAPMLTLLRTSTLFQPLLLGPVLNQFYLSFIRVEYFLVIYREIHYRIIQSAL